MTKSRLRDELQRDDGIEIARAALAFAEAIAYPGLDIEAYVERIEDLAGQARTLARGGSHAERLDVLANHLFTDLGFRGNADNYGDPANSFLNAVVDRRLGLPISLSVLFVEVARRTGLDAHGVGLPGHFIAGVVLDGETVWVDPFYGGRQLSLADCRELIRLSTGYEGPLESAWFQPASARAVLSRMLTNLRITYISRHEWSLAAAAIEQLRIVQPEAAEHLRDLGLVHYRDGNIARAAYYLDLYLARAPEAADAGMIREGAAPFLDAWARQN